MSIYLLSLRGAEVNGDGEKKNTVRKNTQRRLFSRLTFSQIGADNGCDELFTLRWNLLLDDFRSLIGSRSGLRQCQGESFHEDSLSA